jgi:hypothetical protein
MSTDGVKRRLRVAHKSLLIPAGLDIDVWYFGHHLLVLPAKYSGAYGLNSCSKGGVSLRNLVTAVTRSVSVNAGCPVSRDKNINHMGFTIQAREFRMHTKGDTNV